MVALLAFAAANTAQARANWTGAKTGDLTDVNNYQSNNNTWSIYARSEYLAGNKHTSIWINKDVKTFKLGGDESEKYKGLFFEEGTYEFHTKLDDTGNVVKTFDNSAGADTAYDKERICVGSVKDGTAPNGGDNASLTMYDIKAKTRYVRIGSNGDTAGTLTLNKNDAYAMELTANETIFIRNGSMVNNGGTVTAGRFCVGEADGKTGTLTLNSGTVKTTGSSSAIGYAKNSTGVVTIKSGATFHNDGQTSYPNLIIGYESGSSGTVNIQGGTMRISGYIALAYNAAAVKSDLNVTDGGVLEVGYLYKNNNVSGGGTLTVDNGTIKACKDNTDFIKSQNGLEVAVGAGGATFDTAGHAITVTAPLNAASDTAGAFTVTGGGSATFTAMGNLAGALVVGDNTALHWFDQDGAVSATCGFTSLALGAGSTIYLDGDATGVDALPATVTTTATAESKANVVIDFSAIPATGSSFTLFQVASADAFNVSPMFGSLVLPHEVAVVNGNLVLTLVADNYIWNGTQTNWGDADAWTKGGAAATWADGNNAIFNTANATATLAANSNPAKIDFNADATVNGSATLSVPVVDVASGVTATISAPTADPIEKTGAGTLTLGANRTDQTTLSEGTLKMSSGATVDPAKLTLGTDPEKPVTFDYGGRTLSTDLSAAANRYMAPGMDVTLTNGIFHTTANPAFIATTAPNVFTIAKDATFKSDGNFSWNASCDANVDSDTTVNISGGQMVSRNSGNNNWFMQKSRRGKLRFNVTDGGLFQTGGETYIMTCRDDTTAADTPEMYMMFSNSTFRVANNKNLSIGYDEYNKNPREPKFSLAMTNSVLDVGTGIITLGHNVVGENTAGFYTADFVGSVISAKCFKVFHDRPANSARFDNSTIVLTVTDSWSIRTHENFGPSSTPMTIGAGGLTIDTQAFTGPLQADPQGEGAITKKGTGTLKIQRDQTAAAPFVCEGGETYVYDGLSVARAVTVKSGAKFTTKGTGQVTLADISFEAGAELRVDGYDSGVVPIAVTRLTLPESGAVTLTKNNNFSQGKYRILEKTGIAVADVQDKLVPATTGNLAYSWSVEGNTLFLTVGNPSAFAWTGLAGDGKMSTPGNWFGNVAPGAGDPVDFSAVNMAITVEADIDAAFGAVTMGSAVVTFTGSLTATSFSDNSKVEVGANSTVTLDGDLEFTSGNSYITHKVGDGGAFVVTGTIRASDSAIVLPYEVASSGWIVAKGLENAETTGAKWNFRLNNDNVAKWVVGEGGFSGTQYFWSLNNDNSDTTIKADADFTIATWLSAGTSNGKGVTLDTSGRTDPTANYTITADCGFVGVKPLTVKGGGTFLCNYTPTKIDDKVAFSGAVTVTDTATLAINAGKKLTSGAITMNTGTTLEVAQSGDVTLDGKLTCAAGSTLKFNFTTGSTAPKLVLSQTPKFSEVKVSLSGVRPAYGTDGKHTIIEWPEGTTWPEGFDIASVFTLADNQPKWVTGIAVEGDSLVLASTKPAGIMIFVQ